MNTHQLTENVYYSDPVAATDRPLLGLVAGSEGAIAVDAGTSPRHAREFLAGIEGLTGSSFGGGRGELPIQQQFITHWHWDHIFGMQAIGAPSLAHELTAQKLVELRGLAWDDAGLDKLVETGFLPRFAADCLKTEMPTLEERQLLPIDRSFHSAGEIDLGGITCIFEHIGGSHTDDSSILYVPERGVLFLGDCIYERRYKGARGYRLESLVPMRDRLKSFKASHYLVSHEAMYSAESLFKELDSLIEIGELVGETADYQTAAQRYRRRHGDSPDKETSQLIRFFTEPNAALAR